MGSRTPTLAGCRYLCRMLLWWSRGVAGAEEGPFPTQLQHGAQPGLKPTCPRPGLRSLPALQTQVQPRTEIAFPLHQ